MIADIESRQPYNMDLVGGKTCDMERFVKGAF